MTTRPFYADELGTGLRTAQVLGLTASAFLAGISLLPHLQRV